MLLTMTVADAVLASRGRWQDNFRCFDLLAISA